MNEKISLQDLSEKLAENASITKKESELFLREFFEVVNEDLIQSGLVKIKNLGTFKLLPVEDRESIDVTTGERVLIPAHYKVAFAADKKIAEIINEPFSIFETTEIDEESPLDELAMIYNDETFEESELSGDEKKTVNRPLKTPEKYEEEKQIVKTSPFIAKKPAEVKPVYIPPPVYEEPEEEEIELSSSQTSIKTIEETEVETEVETEKAPEEVFVEAKETANEIEIDEIYEDEEEELEEDENDDEKSDTEPLISINKEELKVEQIPTIIEKKDNNMKPLSIKKEKVVNAIPFPIMGKEEEEDFIIKPSPPSAVEENFEIISSPPSVAEEYFEIEPPQPSVAEGYFEIEPPQPLVSEGYFEIPPPPPLVAADNFEIPPPPPLVVAEDFEIPPPQPLVAAEDFEIPPPQPLVAEDYEIPLSPPLVEENFSIPDSESKFNCLKCNDFNGYRTYRHKYFVSRKKIKRRGIVIIILTVLLIAALGYIFYLKRNDILGLVKDNPFTKSKTELIINPVSDDSVAISDSIKTTE